MICLHLCERLLSRTIGGSNKVFRHVETSFVQGRNLYLVGLLLVIQGLFTFRQPIAGLQSTDRILPWTNKVSTCRKALLWVPPCTPRNLSTTMVWWYTQTIKRPLSSVPPYKYFFLTILWLAESFKVLNRSDPSVIIFSRFIYRKAWMIGTWNFDTIFI